MASPKERHSFKPGCSHLTMTRLYTSELVCKRCRRPGSAGWLYQCTEDQEDYIDHMASSGGFDRMDDISAGFVANLKPRKGSAAARETILSLLDELTPEQMAGYSTQQLATLLKQREHVRVMIQVETIRLEQKIAENEMETEGNKMPVLKDFRRPWNGGSYQECRYVVCPSCRSHCPSRASLSLNAVANGEIPPTAAIGYGFHDTGGRPVIDVKLARNLGCRPVPERKDILGEIGSTRKDTQANLDELIWPQGQQPLQNHGPTKRPRLGSSSPDLLETQTVDGSTLAGAELMAEGEVERALELEELNRSIAPMGSLASLESLEISPRCINLVSQDSSALGPGSEKTCPSIWTPPPTPCGVTAGLGFRDGSVSAMGPPPLPQIENAINQGHRPSQEASIDCTTEKGPNAPEDGGFAASPLQVGNGVTLPEESVPHGIPDVITQA